MPVLDFIRTRFLAEFNDVFKCRRFIPLVVTRIHQGGLGYRIASSFATPHFVSHVILGKYVVFNELFVPRHVIRISPRCMVRIARLAVALVVVWMVIDVHHDVDKF